MGPEAEAEAEAEGEAEAEAGVNEEGCHRQPQPQPQPQPRQLFHVSFVPYEDEDRIANSVWEEESGSPTSAVT